MMKTIHVVCALIYDENHRIYASQRGYGEMKDGWEFPGGKIDGNEDFETAIKREMMEEFGVDVTVGRHITSSKFFHKKKKHFCFFFNWA